MIYSTLFGQTYSL